jgi:large subunit ribosomal protein L9
LHLLLITVDIKASLAQAGHEVEKCDINLPEAIHHVGEYDISITLHTNIAADIAIANHRAQIALIRLSLAVY